MCQKISSIAGNQSCMNIKILSLRIEDISVQTSEKYRTIAEKKFGECYNKIMSNYLQVGETFRYRSQNKNCKWPFLQQRQSQTRSTGSYTTQITTTTSVLCPRQDRLHTIASIDVRCVDLTLECDIRPIPGKMLCTAERWSRSF